MIVVYVEHWPKGDPLKRKELAHLKLNYAPGDQPKAPAPEIFEVEAVEHPTKERSETLQTVATFDHARGDGILALVRAAINAIGERARK